MVCNSQAKREKSKLRPNQWKRKKGKQNIMLKKYIGKTADNN